MPLSQEIKEETGNQKTIYGININNLKINFSKSIPKFKNYDTINENKKLKLFSNFYFPIEISKTTYKELENKNVVYNIEEELKKEISNVENIVNTQINYKEEQQNITVEVIYEVLENIGTNEKIVLWKEDEKWQKED